MHINENALFIGFFLNNIDTHYDFARFVEKNLRIKINEFYQGYSLLLNKYIKLLNVK